MKIPRQIRQSVAVRHIPTGTGKQAYPTTASDTITAGIVPMDVKQHALEGGNYVDPALMYYETSADIRIADKLVINTETYFVKKIFDASFCGHPFKRASISKQ